MITIDLILIYFGAIVELLVNIGTVVAGVVIIFSVLSLFFTILFSIMKLVKLDVDMK